MKMPAGLRQVLSPTGGIGRAMSNRNYRLYTIGNIFSLVGTWMQRVGVGWLAWELTHSGTWLGIISAAEFLPSLLAGPLGGVLADRVDRLAVIRIAQILLGLQALAMGILTFLGLMTPLLLAGLTLFLGIVTSFNQPARLSVVTALVRREDISAAVAVNSVLWNGARFVGPAIAGPVIALAGVGWAFVANALTFVVFLVTLAQIRTELPPVARKPGAGFLGDIAEGFRYTVRHPGIGPLILMLIAGSVLARPFAELLPGFADAVFHDGARGLAMLTAATGVGAMIGGIWLGQRGRTEGLVRIIVASLLIFALSLLAFVATAWMPAALVAIACAGFAMVVNGIATQSLIQAAAAPEVLSRVLSLYGLSFRAGPALGALIMGALSDAVGLRLPLACGALLLLLAWLWVWRRREALAAACEPCSA